MTRPWLKMTDEQLIAAWDSSSMLMAILDGVDTGEIDTCQDIIRLSVAVHANPRMVAKLMQGLHEVGACDFPCIEAGVTAKGEKDRHAARHLHCSKGDNFDRRYKEAVQARETLIKEFKLRGLKYSGTAVPPERAYPPDNQQWWD